MTFPQIVIGGEPVGGFQDLVEADRQGRLDQLAA
jgi:glutaredoxin